MIVIVVMVIVVVQAQTLHRSTARKTCKLVHIVMGVGRKCCIFVTHQPNDEDRNSEFCYMYVRNYNKGKN